MKRFNLWTIAILGAVAMVCVCYWLRRSAPAANPAVAMTAIERAAQREAANRLVRMTPPAPLTAAHIGKFSADTIRSAEDKFRQMVVVRGLITQEKERRRLAQQILATPDGKDLVQETLLNPAFARKAFGDFQAEARFYAIKVLDEAARQGNLDPVMVTATDLAAQLRAVSGDPEKGRAEDLVSLAEIVSRNTGSKALTSGSPVLAKLGFAPNMPLPVRSLLVHGFFQGVWKSEGIEAAQTAIKRLEAL